MKHVSTIYARFICRELGIDDGQIDALLRASVLDSKALFEQSYMPYIDFFAFLNNVRDRYDDEELSLKVGKSLVPMSLGEFGGAILVAPNLSEALALASKVLQVNAAYMELTQSYYHSQNLVLEFVELDYLGETQQFQTEAIMLLTQNVIEALVSQPFTEGRFSFPFDAPDNRKYYTKYFNSAFKFGSRHAKVEIPKRYLTVQSPFYNPVLWENYQNKFLEEMDRLREYSHGAFSSQVMEFLLSSSLPLPSVDQVARNFGLSERTLHRRLVKEGENCRAMRNRVLQKHALYYLKETRLTVDAIACQLGYKDFSSFRRTFKKWMKCTPLEYRKMVS